jgi:hypothetical protein
VPYTTLNLGLQLTIPTSGTRNWASTLYATTWSKISSHRHTGSGDGNQLITASYANLSITSAKLGRNIAYGQAATTLTPSGTTQTVDFDLGNTQRIDLGSATGSVTVSFSNSIAGGLYRLFLVQGVTARDIVWPASVKWPQGQVAILSTGNGDIDVVEMYYDGTNYYADWQVGFA